MYHRGRCSLNRLKGLSDNVVPCLGQYLNGHILRNHIPLYKRTDKLILRVGGCREANLNFFKSDLYKHPEKIQFFLQTHRLNQGLISVTQIHTAPDGRCCDRILFYPVISNLGRHKISFSVFFCYIHRSTNLSY